MRTWQHIGFNDYAKKLLSKTKQVGERREEIRYPQPDGSHKTVLGPWIPIIVEDYENELIGSEDVWYGEGPCLERYTFSDGTVLESYVQECPWSSGPMTFMALRTPDGKPVPESLWTEEEIAKY